MFFHKVFEHPDTFGMIKIKKTQSGLYCLQLKSPGLIFCSLNCETLRISRPSDVNRATSKWLHVKLSGDWKRSNAAAPFSTASEPATRTPQPLLIIMMHAGNAQAHLLIKPAICRQVHRPPFPRKVSFDPLEDQMCPLKVKWRPLSTLSQSSPRQLSCRCSFTLQNRPMFAQLSVESQLLQKVNQTVKHLSQMFLLYYPDHSGSPSLIFYVIFLLFTFLFCFHGPM